VSKSSAPICQRRTVIFQARDESSLFGFWLADGRKEKLRRGRYELSRLEIIKEPTRQLVNRNDANTVESTLFVGRRTSGAPNHEEPCFLGGRLAFFSTDAQISDACGRAWNSALLHFRQHGQHRSSVEERGRAAGARSLHCTPDE
jgi:hypothetical protein